MNNDSTKFSVGVTPSFIKIIFEVLEMFLENRLVDEIAGISRMFFRIASKKKLASSRTHILRFFSKTLLRVVGGLLHSVSKKPFCSSFVVINILSNGPVSGPVPQRQPHTATAVTISKLPPPSLPSSLFISVLSSKVNSHVATYDIVIKIKNNSMLL